MFQIQSVLIGSFCFMGLSMIDTISNEINKLIRSNNMVFTTEILKMLEKG